MTIGRDDLEAKFRQVQDAVDETATTARNAGAGIAIGAVVLLVLVFLFGRRKGKQQGGARLEVYRLS